MPRVGRKNNPDYEQIDVKNKNGVSTKRYRKIKENKKEDKVEQVKAPVSPKKQKAKLGSRQPSRKLQWVSNLHLIRILKNRLQIRK